MKALKYTLSLFVIILVFSACQNNSTPPEWDQAFANKGLNGTFLLYDLSAEKLLVYNEARSDSAFTPASTFKICNALIGLQSGTMQSVDDTISWNGHQYPWNGWNQDHNLRTAMPVSCVWFYQEMARRIGRDNMKHWLDELGYGNTIIGDNIDLFWLDGSLQISAKQQLVFLTSLIKNDLSFDVQIQKDVKEILITEKTDEYVIHAKTGWAMRVDKSVGWYVGYVEKGADNYIFVLNYDMTNPKEQSQYRKQLTYELLRFQQIIP